MKNHLKWYGFIYFLLVAWLGSAALQLINQADEVTQTAATHGEPFLWADFWPVFFAATFENWQSEFLQLLVQACGMVLFAKVVFRKAKEDSDRLEAKVDELRDRA